LLFGKPLAWSLEEDEKEKDKFSLFLFSENMRIFHLCGIPRQTILDLFKVCLKGLTGVDDYPFLLSPPGAPCQLKLTPKPTTVSLTPAGFSQAHNGRAAPSTRTPSSAGAGSGGSR
jgi:hypothetical protein